MFLVESQVFLPSPSEKSLVCGLIKSLRKIFMFDGYSNISADVLMDVRIPDALLDLMYRVETVSFSPLIYFRLLIIFVILQRSDIERQEVCAECIKVLSAILGSSKRCKVKR
jgi:hypothetical protein